MEGSKQVVIRTDGPDDFDAQLTSSNLAMRPFGQRGPTVDNNPASFGGDPGLVTPPGNGYGVHTLELSASRGEARALGKEVPSRREAELTKGAHRP